MLLTEIYKRYLPCKSCDCCGTPVNMLKPFGKSGNPIAGDHEGKYLVCRRRFYYERFHHELYNISQEFESYGDGKNNLSDLVAKYGEIKANDAIMYLRLSGVTRKSAECRDCIVKLRTPLTDQDSVNHDIDERFTHNQMFFNVDQVDWRCFRCGRHVSELKCFESFDYSLIAVSYNFRRLSDYHQKIFYRQILEEVKSHGESQELWDACGWDNVKKALNNDPYMDPIMSIECRDCFLEKGDFYHYSWKDREKTSADNAD